jgi:hypothetical protein
MLVTLHHLLLLPHLTSHYIIHIIVIMHTYKDIRIIKTHIHTSEGDFHGEGFLKMPIWMHGYINSSRQ